MTNAVGAMLVRTGRVAGDITISRADGVVIDGLDVDGSLTILDSPGVRMFNTRIRGELVAKNSPRLRGTDVAVWGTAPRASGTARALVFVVDGSDDFVFERLTIAPEFPNVRQNGFQTNCRGTITRSRIGGVVDGIVLYGPEGVTIDTVLVDDLRTYDSDPNQGGKPSHSDAVQIQRGFGHRIINSDLDSGNNAAVMVTQDAGPVGDLLIQDSTLGGGQVTVNFKTNDPKRPYIAPVRMENVRIRRNQLAAGKFKNGGAILHNPAITGLQLSRVVWDDTSATVTADKGA